MAACVQVPELTVHGQPEAPLRRAAQNSRFGSLKGHCPAVHFTCRRLPAADALLANLRCE